MTTATKRLVLCGVMAALSLALLAAAYFLPAGRIGLCALAGIPAAVAVMRHGIGAGAMTWLASGLLALFLFSFSDVSVMYIMAFGLYPVVKSCCERMPRRWREWALKFLFCNAALAAALAFPFVLGLETALWDVAFWPLLWLGVNAAFIAYDIGLSRLLGVLQHRITRM